MLLTTSDNTCQPKIEQVDSIKSWKMLGDIKDSVLIDVRTPEEWRSTGIPNLSKLGRSVVMLSWFTGEGGIKQFIDEFKKAIPNTETTVFFICHAGGRSHNAAQCMTNLGYKNCFNIFDGFGRKPEGHSQKSSKGWKFSNLPWEQF